MKFDFEDWDESFMDVEDYQVEQALTQAALDAIHRARRFGTKYVIWEDEKVKCLGPDETGPYEDRLCKQVEELARKIAELQKHSPAALALNDRPKK